MDVDFLAKGGIEDKKRKGKERKGRLRKGKGELAIKWRFGSSLPEKWLP